MSSKAPRHLKKENKTIPKHEQKEPKKEQKQEQVNALIKINQKINLPTEEIKVRRKYKKELLICLIYAIIVETYFIVLNIISTKLNNFDICIKTSYMVLILISILMFEISYKKQNKNFLVTGIEFLILAIHTLLLQNTITVFNENKGKYILLTSCIWPIYYCLKLVIIQTKESRRRFRKISDIQEIIKEEKPTKKLAKKRKK